MNKIMVLVLILLLIAAPMAAMARDDSADDSSGRNGGDDSRGSDDGPRETETVREQEIETLTTVTGTVSPGETETEHGLEIEIEHGVVVIKEHGGDTAREKTNVTELSARIREQETESVNELARQGIDDSVVREGQSSFLVGIDSFRLVRELNDTQGRTLSEMEAEIEDSVRVTSRAESRIRSRSPVVRLLVGGDDKAALELEAESERTRERITGLQGMVDSCTTCSDQVKELLRERIQEMEQELERLHEVASQELASQGIIGWIWK